LTARKLNVPGDLSTAVFLIGAALVLPESSLMLRNVGLNPTRARVLDFFISIGAPVHVASIQSRDGELAGDVSVRHAALEGGTVAGTQVGEMIDELPMLAALGPFTEKGIEIHDAAELRVKESDRIAAMSAGLTALRVVHSTLPDGMCIEGRGEGKAFEGGVVESFGDHRIAMSFSIASLRAAGVIAIRDVANVATSFPGFVPLAQSVGLAVREVVY
jgi:3-phosphoshikimate 1-carboxyvinyltransferase